MSIYMGADAVVFPGSFLVERLSYPTNIRWADIFLDEKVVMEAVLAVIIKSFQYMTLHSPRTSQS